MPATQKKNIWCPRTISGVAPSTDRVKMAATQGIYIADSPAYGSESGTAKRADTADGSDALNLLLTDAPTAAHAANDIVVAVVLTTDCLLELYVETAGSDNAATQALVNNDYGHVVSSTTGEIGYTTLNINDTAGTTFIVQDVKGNLEPVKFDLTTAPGVAICTVIETVISAQKS